MRPFRYHEPEPEPPREGWVVLVDRDGCEMTERIPVVVRCDPHEFRVDHDLHPRMIESGVVTAVRVIDADGKTHDQPIT